MPYLQLSGYVNCYCLCYGETLREGVQCSRELNFFFPWRPIDSLKLKDQYHLQPPIFSGLYSLWGLAVPFTHCSKFRQLAPLGIPSIELGKLFDTLY